MGLFGNNNNNYNNNNYNNNNQYQNGQNSNGQGGQNQNDPYSNSYSRPSLFGGRGGRNSSLMIIVVIIILYVLYSLVGPQLGCSGTSSSPKTKLEGTVEPVVYFEGKSEYVSSDQLSSLMKEFFDTTGVQPFIYDISDQAKVADTSAFQDIVEKYYEENFNDETHFLIGFQKFDTGYYIAFKIGAQARNIISEDGQPFLGYFDQYVKTASPANVFPNTFEVVNKNIMGSPMDKKVLIIILIIAIVGYFAYTFLKNRKKQGTGDGGNGDGSNGSNGSNGGGYNNGGGGDNGYNGGGNNGGYNNNNGGFGGGLFRNNNNRRW